MFVHWRYQMPIGGWLILIALGLALTPVIVFATVINNGSFDLSKWNLALPGASKAVYKAAFTFEILGNIFSICYTAFCFFLLIKRRDIFPKFVIGLYAYYVVFHFVDYALLQATGIKLDTDDSKDMIRSMVAAAIWIPYFIKSTRVQKTFIMPYPVSNYAFDTSVQPQTDVNEQEIKEGNLPG
jgi:hypothetical protein